VPSSSTPDRARRPQWRQGLAGQSVVVLWIAVVLRVALLGLQALIARRFSVADFNFFITANIIGALASIASDVGLTTTVIFVARGDGASARLLVAWLQRRRLVAAFAFWVIGSAAVLALRHDLTPGDVEVAGLLIASYVVQGYSRYQRSPLIAEQKPVPEAQLEFLDRGLAVVGAFVPMLFSRSLIYVAAGQLVGALAGYATARIAVPAIPRQAMNWSRSAMRYGLSLSIAVLATQLYARLDYLVLSQLATQSRAATYAATYNLILGFTLLPIALTRVATSHLSAGESTAKARRDYFAIALATGVIGGAVIALAGPISVRSLFRLDDPQLPTLCLVLGLAFVFMSVNSTIGVMAPKGGTEVRFLAVVGLALVVNLIACVALIPFFGMLGAGIATALTELFVAFAWWMVPRGTPSGNVSQPPVVSLIDP
jgi:O-antigen/teichoic acid export membrane protein